MKRRKHLKRRSQRSFKLVHLFPLLSTFLLLAILIILFRSSLFRITDIDCSFNNQACPRPITDHLSQYHNYFYFFLKPSKISSNLKQLDPSITDTTVTTVFPKKINILISSSETIYALYLVTPLTTPVIEPSPDASSASESALPTPHPYSILPNLNLEPTNKIYYNSSGNLINPTAPPNTPQPIYYLSLSPDKETLTSLAAFQLELTKSGLSFSHAWADPPNLIIMLQNNTLVVLPLDQDAYKLISSLQQIRSASTIDLNRAIIDMRFKKPVITSLEN